MRGSNHQLGKLPAGNRQVGQVAGLLCALGGKGARVETIEDAVVEAGLDVDPGEVAGRHKE